MPTPIRARLRLEVSWGMLSWDDLRYVLALSREGNAMAAGKAMGVNATTVTRRIQAIEAQLGARLFDRRSTGAIATDAGTAAVQTALRIEQEVFALDAEVRGLDAELRGTLRITSTEMFFQLWRADFNAFQRRMPYLDLILAANNVPVDLSRREADAALRMSSTPPEYLVGRRFCEIFFGVYGAESLVRSLTNDETTSLPYSAYPWIGWDAPLAAPTDRVIERVAKGARVALRVNTMALLDRAIADGIGISVMPCFHGDRTPGLVRVGPYFEGGTYLWALTHEPLRKTARFRAFVELIAAAVDRDTELLLGQAPVRPPVKVTDDGQSG